MSPAPPRSWSRYCRSSSARCRPPRPSRLRRSLAGRADERQAAVGNLRSKSRFELTFDPAVTAYGPSLSTPKQPAISFPLPRAGRMPSSRAR